MIDEYVIVRMAPGVHSVVGTFYDEALAVQYAKEHGWSYTVLKIEHTKDLFDPWCRDWQRARKQTE